MKPISRTTERFKKIAFPFLAYVLKRLGLETGILGEVDAREKAALILSSVFLRPFAAPSLSQFWIRWNPVYGYFLSRYVYRPLRTVFPRSLNVLVTFAFSGFILHDAFLWRAAGGPPLATTTWFVVIALGILCSERARRRARLFFDRDVDSRSFRPKVVRVLTQARDGPALQRSEQVKDD